MAAGDDLGRVDARTIAASAIGLGVVRLVLLQPADQDRIVDMRQADRVLVGNDGHSNGSKGVKLVRRRALPQPDVEVNPDVAVRLHVGRVL
jgi:hypothetical protein